MRNHLGGYFNNIGESCVCLQPQCWHENVRSVVQEPWIYYEDGGWQGLKIRMGLEGIKNNSEGSV